MDQEVYEEEKTAKAPLWNFQPQTGVPVGIGRSRAKARWGVWRKRRCSEWKADETLGNKVGDVESKLR